MTIHNSIRRFSARSIVDKLFNILQASSPAEKQAKLFQFIKKNSQHEKPNLLTDAIHHWKVEQPTKEALWTFENNCNKLQKLTFHDVYDQSSRIANVLTGQEFNLEQGKTVLVILPNCSPERILIQLACLQSGLIFCPYDPKDMTDTGIPERIQKLAINCIITNNENLEIARKYTHNPLRPLKKGLITNCSIDEPLPVGWNHVMRSVNNAKSEYTKVMNIDSSTPIIRLLSNNNEVIQYSQKDFYLHLITSAVWLNINRTSRLIWMKNSNEAMSIAPWLFGSTIFYKDTKNLSTMLKTFEDYPIDTFCASPNDYEILNNEQSEHKTHLKQLTCAKSVDPISKINWNSLTKLIVRDDYEDFYADSTSIPLSNDTELQENFLEHAYYETKHFFQQKTSSKKMFYQYPINRQGILPVQPRI